MKRTLLLLVVLGLTACGSHSKGADERLSYEDFGTRTEAICAAGRARAAEDSLDPAHWSVRRWRRELAFDRRQVSAFVGCGRRPRSTAGGLPS